MKIRFIRQVEMEITVDEYGNTTIEAWNVGDESDVTLLNDRENTVDIQFGDGTVAYDVFKDCFETEGGPKTYTFEVIHDGEYSAGIRAYTDTITVTVESGDAGGDDGDFEHFIKTKLAEWYDGAKILTDKELKELQKCK